MLVLPDVCLKALRAHRTNQREERLKAGADWTETGLVFTTYGRRGKKRKIGAPLPVEMFCECCTRCSIRPSRKSPADASTNRW
jgi:hypothetical protein